MICYPMLKKKKTSENHRIFPGHGSFMALGCLLYSTSETDTYDIGLKITKCYTTCPQFGWNLPAVGKKLSRIWWFSEDLLVLWVLTHANHRGERLWISWVFENWIFEGINHVSWIFENCDTPFQSLHMHVSCKQNHILQGRCICIFIPVI